MFALILFGWISFRQMGVSQMPDVDFPVLTITLNYDGAAPEVLESDVVDPVEDAVMSVQGIRTVSSYSRQGSATVTVEFELNRSIDVALQEVQAKIAQVQKNLPREIDPPIITKTNPEDQPILWLTLSSEMHPTAEMMKFVRDHLKDRFTTVAGVGEVFLGGYVEPNLRVWLSNQGLNKYELTVGDVLSTIQDEHSELPAGEIETPRREFSVRTMGEAKSLDEFQKIVINRRGSAPNYNPIAVKQVARIEEGLGQVRRISRFNGVPAVGLGIRKQRGANAVQVAHGVKERMAEIQSQLPEGMRLALNFDTTKFIEESVGELNFTLVLSALLTSLVCWLFLGSWTSTLNVLLAIPTSLIGAFTVLHFMGFTLNTFTLLGLSLATGIVVDDAIMVLENIVRHREKGKSRMDAALEGAREISSAAVAATVAIVAVFLPVAFMRGVIGKFFFQFGVTMTVTVLISLLEALTLTPMRCSKFVESGERATAFGHGIEKLLARSASLYRTLLERILNHRWKVVIVSLLFFAGSMSAAKFLNKEFVPAQDQSAFMIRIQTPVDSSMAYTNSKFMEVEKVLSVRPEIERFYVAVGGFGGSQVNTGMIFVTLKEKGHRGVDSKLGRELSQGEIMDALRGALSKIPDVKPFMQDLSMRGFTASRGFPVEFSLRGPELEQLAKYSSEIISRLEKTGLVTDLDSDYRLGKPEIRIYPDREKAAQRGVSVRAISETVNAMIGGVARGKYQMGGRRYDVRVQLEAEQRGSAEQIKNIFVRNNRGELVRLSDIVRIEERRSLQQIARYDRERAVNIFANVKAGQSQAQAIEAAQRIGREVLPSGYRIVMSGSAQSFKESFRDLIFALVLGIIVAYMVLGSQFNSFVDPLTVLMALPFSLSGAFLAMLLTKQSLNIYSFIGLILLMGIVKKNSILLVEFTHHVLAAGGKSVREALLEACPLRLRPILMTSIATVAGALPAALAIGPGAETRIPMAVAVIGGVIVSTLLTLIVVPCVYSLFSSFHRGTIKSAAVSTVSTGALLLVGVCLARSPLALAEVTPPAVPLPSELHLQEAISIALEQSPNLQAFRERITEAEAQITQARATVLPNISGTVWGTYRKDASEDPGSRFQGEPYNQYQLGLRVTQPLFVLGSLSAIDSFRQESGIRTLDREVAARDLSRDVILSFYKILLDQTLLEALVRTEAIQKESLTTAEYRHRIGRGQLLDVLQVKTELALLAPRIEQAKTQIVVDSARLATLLGSPETRELKPRGSLDKIPLRQLSESERGEAKPLPELERNLASQRKNESERSGVLGQNWPQLNAIVDWSRFAFSGEELLSSSVSSWSLGLQLSIPIFSGLSSLSERRIFAARQSQLEYQMNELQNQISFNQIQAQRELQLRREVIISASEAYSLAGKSVSEAQRAYRLATIDFIQFLSAQRAYLEARSSLYQARYDYLSALTNYFVASGIPLNSLLSYLKSEK